jgi:hypothetical protein
MLECETKYSTMRFLNGIEIFYRLNKAFLIHRVIEQQGATQRKLIFELHLQIGLQLRFSRLLNTCISRKYTVAK